MERINTALTKAELSHIILLVESEQKKPSSRNNTELQSRYDKLLFKLSKLDEIHLELDLDKSLPIVKDTLENLEKLNVDYSNVNDISQVAVYDDLKKKFGLYMSTLSEYMGIFQAYDRTIEAKVSKGIKEQITQRIIVEEGVSRNKAKELVEADARYLNACEKMRQVIEMAETIKYRYYTYQNIHRDMNQSVSVSINDSVTNRR